MGHGNPSLMDLFSQKLGKGLTLQEIETGSPSIRAYGNTGNLQPLVLCRGFKAVFSTKGKPFSSTRLVRI